MNKKGFTIIELVTSLTLATVIMIFLFNLVFILKDVYLGSEAKATLLIEQAAISEEVNSFLYSNEISEVSKCTTGNHCLKITTSAGTKEFVVKTTDKKIQFGNYLYKLDDSAKFGTIKVCYIKLLGSEANDYNKILIMDVPISHKSVTGNFGLKSATPIKSSVTFDGRISEC